MQIDTVAPALAQMCQAYVFGCQGLAALVLSSLAALVAILALLVRRRREQALHVRPTLDDENLLWILAEHAQDGLVVTDLNGVILWVNPAYCKIMGWRAEEILGRKPQEFCYPPEQRISAAEIAAFRFTDDHIDLNRVARYENIRRNGERFWHELSCTLVEPQPGTKYAVLVTRDVSDVVRREQQLEAARDELEYSATHDVLTGLADRRMFLALTDGLLHHSDPKKRAVGLLHIDLNHFKIINDTFGHAAGDVILRHVADSIRGNIRAEDLACRLGGDEFVIVCPGLTDFPRLEAIAAAVLAAIAVPITWQDHELTCTASIGIAVDVDGSCDNHELMHNADFALYQVKRDRSRSIACFDSKLHNERAAQEAMVAEFAGALDTDQLYFRHQPIFNAEQGLITGFETLARWRRKNGEVIDPTTFLKYAGLLGRRAEIDFAAMRETVDILAHFKSLGIEVSGSFNSSTDSLARRDIVSQLDWEMQRFDIDPARLIVEVLETTWFGDLKDNTAVSAISGLRDAGYTVYLDDFGVGYAGLGHLDMLGVHGIKVDRSLICRMMQEKSALIIVNSLLRLSEELGLKVIAEGIETHEEQEALVGMGCLQHQGFGIAMPMKRDDLIDLIEAQHGRLSSLAAKNSA